MWENAVKGMSTSVCSTPVTHEGHIPVCSSATAFSASAIHITQVIDVSTSLITVIITLVLMAEPVHWLLTPHWDSPAAAHRIFQVPRVVRSSCLAKPTPVITVGSVYKGWKGFLAVFAIVITLALSVSSLWGPLLFLRRGPG